MTGPQVSHRQSIPVASSSVLLVSSTHLLGYVPCPFSYFSRVTTRHANTHFLLIVRARTSTRRTLALPTTTPPAAPNFSSRGLAPGEQLRRRVTRTLFTNVLPFHFPSTRRPVLTLIKSILLLDARRSSDNAHRVTVRRLAKQPRLCTHVVGRRRFVTVITRHWLDCFVGTRTDGVYPLPDELPRGRVPLGVVVVVAVLVRAVVAPKRLIIIRRLILNVILVRDRVRRVRSLARRRLGPVGERLVTPNCVQLADEIIGFAILW